MAQVPPAPRPLRSYDGDRREVLSELGRIDREKPPLNPGSVQSTDGSTIRIPGPLADTGRDGKVLTWDEDLHQPTWQAGGGGVQGITRIYAWSRTTAPSASSTLVTPTGLEVGEQLYGAQVADVGSGGVALEAGVYMVKMDAWLAWSLSATATRCQYWMDYPGSVYHYPRLDVSVFPDLASPAGSGPDAIASWTVGPIKVNAGTLAFGAVYSGTGSAPGVNYWSLDVARLG